MSLLVRMGWCLAGVMTLGAVVADNRTMSFNSEILVLPAPGPVTVDGKTDDWDLSAGVFSYNDPQVAARHSVWTHLMWDAKGVYLLGRYRDDTPFVNATKGIDFSKSWLGDCYQARVIFDNRTDDEHQMHIDMYYSRPDGRGYIAVKHGGHKDRPPYDETGPSRADQLARWGNDMTAVGGLIAFGRWPDSKGYDMEVFWPWTAIRTSGRQMKPGEEFVFGLEAFWSDSNGENPFHRLADGIRDEGVNRIFMFSARDGWGRAVIADKGNRTITAQQEALHRDRLARFADFGTEGSVKIDYTLPEARDVTIAIDNAEGLRVRSLIGQYPRAAGRNTDWWDCLDDDGNPVKPGRYDVTVVHHRPLGLKYRTSLYNAATPPWRSDGPFRLWGSNHGYPTSVATDGRHTVLFFTGTEGMSGMMLVDANGLVQWADVNEFQDGTMDDRYVYGLSRSGWQNVVLLQRNRLSDGKVEPFEDEKRLPNQVIVKGDWQKASDYSTLALAHGRLWALMPGFRFIVADPKTGLAERELPADRYAAVTDRNGRLYALTTDGAVVLLDAEGNVSRECFRTSGVTRGVRLGIDLAEKRFAVTDAATNQIVLFDDTGRRLGALGRAYAGETRPAGRFVETDFVRPIGSDFDAQGRLWVAEGSPNCKRVTRWSADGKLEDQFWGAADYGAMCAFPIVADATRFIAHGVEFEVDAHPEPYRRKTAERPLLNQPFLARTRGLVHRVNGRDYACAAPGYGNPKKLEMFLRDADGVFRPILRLDLRQRVHRNGQWIVEPGQAWLDLDGNHAEDAGETFAVDCAGTYWANGCVRPDDLAILTTDNKLFVPTGFTEKGIPVYDFAHPRTTGDGTPYLQTRKSTGTPVIDRAGNVSDGIRFFAADGRHGHYPNRWGRHDAPAARRGALIAPFRVNGVVEDVPGVGAALAVGGDRGQWFLLSTDGLYLGAICQDTKGEVVLDETFIGQEAFGGFFWRDRASGRPMVQIGHSCYTILELTGLETTVKERLTVEVDVEQIAAGERIVQARVAREIREPASIVINEVRSLPTAAPAALLDAGTTLLPGATDTFVAEEGDPSRWFRASLCHDRRELGIAFQVADASPWCNAEGRYTHAFIGGDAVDVKLDVPGVGPIRILAAPVDGKPTAVFWRKRSPCKGFEITYSVGNNLANAETFEEVRRLDSAKIDVNVAANGYAVLVRVPLKDVDLDRVEPGKLKGTVGVIHSNPAGNNRVARIYWHDKETGLVSDVPSEARLRTEGFGDMEWR